MQVNFKFLKFAIDQFFNFSLCLKKVTVYAFKLVFPVVVISAKNLEAIVFNPYY